jgi:hypothetical protein
MDSTGSLSRKAMAQKKGLFDMIIIMNCASGQCQEYGHPSTEKEDFTTMPNIFSEDVITCQRMIGC